MKIMTSESEKLKCLYSKNCGIHIYETERSFRPITEQGFSTNHEARVFNQSTSLYECRKASWYNLPIIFFCHRLF
jgi:hypothetical protein